MRASSYCLNEHSLHPTCRLRVSLIDLWPTARSSPVDIGWSLDIYPSPLRLLPLPLASSVLTSSPAFFFPRKALPGPTVFPTREAACLRTFMASTPNFVQTPNATYAIDTNTGLYLSSRSNLHLRRSCSLHMLLRRPAQTFARVKVHGIKIRPLLLRLNATSSRDRLLLI
jgi:hypothetical protein